MKAASAVSPRRGLLQSARPLLAIPSRASAGAATIGAVVARAVARHDRSTILTSGSVRLLFTRCIRLKVGGRRSHSFGTRWGRGRGREKFQSEVTEDVIHQRLGVADLRVCAP